MSTVIKASQAGGERPVEFAFDDLGDPGRAELKDAGRQAAKLLAEAETQARGLCRLAEEQGRAYGESVFVPREGSRQEDDGWLLAQGYDAVRDENFLEIRDAASLELAARAWTTTHFPLGFHGNFVPKTYIST